jgi:hypothetical protein
VYFWIVDRIYCVLRGEEFACVCPFSLKGWASLRRRKGESRGKWDGCAGIEKMHSGGGVIAVSEV